MSYVSRAISDEERLLSLARPHWIYLIAGFFWLLLFIAIGLGADIYFGHFLQKFELDFFIDLKILYFSGVLTPVSAIFIMIGLVSFWPFFKIFISSEIGLTNERIILKTGLIFIEIDQVDLEDIRAEHVHHGLLGWLLHYGSIRLDCRFIHDVKIPAIATPYRFVEASHNARLKHPKIKYDEDEFAENIKLIEHKIHINNPRIKNRLKNTFKMNFRKSSENEQNTPKG